MANRLLTQFFYSFFKKLCSLHLVFDVGATGAPTLVAAESIGIASIARSAAGQYTITLQDRWYSFITMRAILEDALAEDISFQIKSYDLAAKTISFITRAAAADADPSNGARVRIELLFNDTVAR